MGCRFPLPYAIPCQTHGLPCIHAWIVQANEGLQQELNDHRPGTVSEALAISERLPPPSSPAAKRAAVEDNSGGPADKRCAFQVAEHEHVRLGNVVTNLNFLSTLQRCHRLILTTPSCYRCPGLEEPLRGGAENLSLGGNLGANRYARRIATIHRAGFFTARRDADVRFKCSGYRSSAQRHMRVQAQVWQIL